MDNDTTFPALFGGEIIVSKYEGYERSQMKKAIVILTNVRLLIRWEEMLSSYFRRYSYSSIILDSIDRIDEARQNENLPILAILTLLTGLISDIFGFTYVLEYIQPTSTALVIIGVIMFVFLWYCRKKQCITMKGTFGLETIVFEKAIAGEFFNQLSEMILQRRTQCSMKQKNEYNGP
ncbi:unnamed protein product [Adineta ricciae]|uniref:Uncharacterized protein n=1 Tax=Adineta ricciae TaxID=249248 RepID=A0A815NTT6_ADIRI|nr:unnamed protein product [Adineta ricciae]CAF1438278.1 unnamed protein product [Adineta ricciae]